MKTFYNRCYEMLLSIFFGWMQFFYLVTRLIVYFLQLFLYKSDNVCVLKVLQWNNFCFKIWPKGNYLPLILIYLLILVSRQSLAFSAAVYYSSGALNLWFVLNILSASCQGQCSPLIWMLDHFLNNPAIPKPHTK